MVTVVRARRPHVEITSGGSGSGSGQLTFAQYKQALLDERKGYALFGNVTGGFNAAGVTVVNTTANSGTGSLRDALTGGSTRWIVFDPAVFPPTTPTTITLSSTINMRNNSNITLDGFGSQVDIAGFGITTADWIPTGANNISNNLIIANVKMRSISSGNFDCLTIDGTDRAWFYHLDLSGAGDGNFDITQTEAGPNPFGMMTIQNCYMHDSLSGKNMIFGNQSLGTNEYISSTSNYPTGNGGNNRATLVDCRFKDRLRNPVTANHWVHQYNNYYHGWELEGPSVMGLMGAIRVENSVLDGAGATQPTRGIYAWTFGYPDNAKKYKRWANSGNVFLNSAAQVDNSGGFLNPPLGSIFTVPYSYSAQSVTGDSGAALIARLASSSESTQGRAGRIIRAGYYERVLGQ